MRCRQERQVNFEKELKKVLLEVQHELHIAETKKEYNFRKKQLHRLIKSAKKHFGGRVIRKQNNL